MSKQIGKGTDAYAIVVKGRELAAHDPRGDKTQGLHLLHRHKRGGSRRGSEPKALLSTAMVDSLCLCSFTSNGRLGRRHGRRSSLTCSTRCAAGTWKTSDYWTTAKRIVTAERVFNVREGISSKDDRLPKRMYKDKLPPAPGRTPSSRTRTRRKMETDTYRILRLGRQGHSDGGKPQGL